MHDAVRWDRYKLAPIKGAGANDQPAQWYRRVDCYLNAAAAVERDLRVEHARQEEETEMANQGIHEMTFADIAGNVDPQKIAKPAAEQRDAPSPITPDFEKIGGSQYVNK